MSSHAVLIDEIADTIDAKRNLYRSCYRACLKSLESKHGTAALAAALAQLEPSPRAGTWDKAGHARAVEDAVDRLLERRRSDPDGFDDGAKI
jgi:hypothetical protein